jgi:RAP1 GTPase activating protein 1
MSLKLKIVNTGLTRAERTRSQMLEDLVANLQNHAETGQIPKPYRWLGYSRDLKNTLASKVLLAGTGQLFEPHM